MNKKSFADLGVSPVVARTLDAHGVKSPFPVQASVIPDALAGHDVLVPSGELDVLPEARWLRDRPDVRIAFRSSI